MNELNSKGVKLTSNWNFESLWYNKLIMLLLEFIKLTPGSLPSSLPISTSTFLSSGS